MLRSRSSRPDRQALARSHGGLSCSKLLVTAAIITAACIVFLNSNRIRNIDLHGGSRVRLRVKQGLSFDDALPGVAHEAEHPWYDSAEKHSGGEIAAITDLPSTHAEYASDGIYTVDGMDSAGVLSAEARMEQFRGKPLNREALEKYGRDSVDRMDSAGASGAETWREQLLGDIPGGDGSTGKQDPSGPRGKQETGYLDSSGSRSSADPLEDRVDTVRDSRGETEQDPSAGIGEEQPYMAEQSRGEQQGPYDEGAMSEGGNSGEEEDTWMVKLFKEMERKSKEEVKDPALEAGSRIFDLEASEPAVQRLLALLQMDAVSADSGRDVQESTGAKHKGSSSKEHDGEGADSQLKLVGLYSDEAESMPHSNPKLATWEEDLVGHLVKVEDAKKVEKARLQTEQEARHPAIPTITGVLDRSKVIEGAAKEEENRPARVDDLLEAEELEQRLREEGRLDEILADPELIPDWNTQFTAQESRAFQ